MKAEGNTQASLVCFGVSSKAKNPKDSGFFVASLMDEFAQKTWAENGFGIPVVKEYAKKYYVQPNEKPNRQQMLPDALEVAFPPIFTVNTGKTKALWDNSYKLTWSGEKPAKDIMLSIKDEIEKMLASKD